MGRVRIVNFGEVFLKFRVAELVDRTRLAQDLAVVGVFQYSHEVNPAGSGDREDELGEPDHTRRTDREPDCGPEREPARDPGRGPEREPGRELGREPVPEPVPGRGSVVR